MRLSVLFSTFVFCATVKSQQSTLLEDYLKNYPQCAVRTWASAYTVSQISAQKRAPISRPLGVYTFVFKETVATRTKWISSVGGSASEWLSNAFEFEWLEPQQEAMRLLKEALLSAPALIKIDYSKEGGKTYLTVDASLKGWGAVLQQEDSDKKRHPARFESGLWNPAESKYDATKRECRGALKAMKKMRSELYGVHFILETDAKVLVDQLNGSASDLPGALVTNWIAWMRLMDFEVKHILGTKNAAADGLSRRGKEHPSDKNSFLLAIRESFCRGAEILHFGHCGIPKSEPIGDGVLMI
ncbi:gag-pol polyprotein [Drepanopeziza brunnea f. sp. 'multigermtubi' MB_m1]|uniref:Gag-pol polyprotein n=1 Tax=Marssonina brunnea f. sp. multigermtubi (strain MB_m1) TaxID=1072389 RepID=K1XX21_MARBU|nr:gag-pol polyprotein [Drepanopeziza brunnea f. sp. 'multigermtubi' MB_m1]EKD17314.1 gag-pol polyprotein [Drepanopeziza brunnea f. sp. 'multigermtubi' MB_m1]